MNRKLWVISILGIICFTIVSITFTQAPHWLQQFDLNRFAASITQVNTSESNQQRWAEKVTRGSGQKKLVVLKLEGEITETPIDQVTIHMENFLSQIDQLIEDPDVVGTVIRVNSSGGEVAATEEIYRHILRLKQSGKMVTISMGTMATSGGYYISAPADYIFALNSTDTGSLGVIQQMQSLIGFEDKLEYNIITYKSGAFKDMGNAYREMTPEEDAILQAQIDENFQEFVSVIEKGRKLNREQVLKLADGRIYTGKQAKQLGLVDEIGSLRDAIDYTLHTLNTPDATVLSYVEQ